MAGELVTKQNSIVAMAGEHGLDTMLKPLVREIYLFDTHIAGTSYLKDKTPLEGVAVGDELILQREGNAFDKNAILVLNSDKKKLGYIPERDNIVFTRLMDAGKLLKARVTRINPLVGFLMIDISLFLLDF